MTVVRLKARSAHVAGSGTTVRLPVSSLNVRVCPPLLRLKVSVPVECDHVAPVPP